MRTLIHVPIVHAPSDLGSLADRVASAYKREKGARAWTRHVRAVLAAWSAIERAIAGLHLDLRRVTLFQDGLPVCGKEFEIVRDLAAAGSPNYCLLLKLMEGGARLAGTEDGVLVVREVLLARDGLKQGRMPRLGAPEDVSADAQANLMARDRFIARRVDETLRVGETGILFLGMAHAIDPYLPKDVRVVQLEFRLLP